MSIVNRIPYTARPNILDLRVSVGWDPVAGQYNFTTYGVAETTLNMNSGNVYLLDKMSWCTNVDQVDWLNSELYDETFFRVYYQIGEQNQIVFPKKIVLSKYQENADLCYWYYHEQDLSRLILRFDGIHIQTPAMVGLQALDISLQLWVYEITDSKFVKAFVEGKTSDYYKFLTGMKV